jgi:uncharacterized membrane protein YqaE (UPF0057 family)
MRNFIKFCLVLFCLATLPIQQLSAAIMPVQPVEPTSQTFKSSEAYNVSQQLKQHRKDIRKALKQAKPQGNNNQVLCAVIAIFIPFLGVALWSGINIDFWITLLLTFLFFIPGLIYALYVILAK